MYDDVRVFALEKAVPIFQKLAKGADGRLILGADDFLMIDTGTNQRRQAPFKSSLAPFKPLGAATELLRSVAESMSTLETKLKIQSPVVLINTQEVGQPPVSAQDFHVDIPPTSPATPGFVAIMAMESDVTLLVMPYSGIAVRDFIGFKNGCSTLDQKLPELFPKFKAIRVKLKVGHILLLNGDTVHAGDCGVDGKHGLRIHWYAQADEVLNETFTIEQFGDGFGERFS
jgi:hypothetical protein